MKGAGPGLVGWIYCGEYLCDDCAHRKMEELDNLGISDFGDSNEYPQPVFFGESDYPTHCARDANCINYREICGIKVGDVIPVRLTSEGVDYVRESWEEVKDKEDDDYQKNLVRLWIDEYKLEIE